MPLFAGAARRRPGGRVDYIFSVKLQLHDWLASVSRGLVLPDRLVAFRRHGRRAPLARVRPVRKPRTEERTKASAVQTTPRPAIAPGIRSGGNACGSSAMPMGA